MSAFYQYQHHPTAANPVPPHHHGGRSRRAPRMSTSQNSHKQFRARTLRDVPDTAAISTFKMSFEAGRGFDLDDDMEFCRNLLTDSDLISINSSASDRSSLASVSPEASPTQQPQQVAPTFSLNSASAPYIPSGYSTSSQPPSVHSTNSKLHQPAATRPRNAIPIVNPQTGISMASPPPSVSPARMQGLNRRAW